MTRQPAPLLPRDKVVPLSVVTQHFPDVTKEAGTGPNETSVGKPIAAISVVFTDADGKKKVTLSVDQYASASDAATAYQTAVQGSLTAPGFKPAETPKLGKEAFAGTSQVWQRDALWSRRTRRQADHVCHACRGHSHNAGKLEKPRHSRRHGAYHRQAGARCLGEHAGPHTTRELYPGAGMARWL